MTLHARSPGEFPVLRGAFGFRKSITSTLFRSTLFFLPLACIVICAAVATAQETSGGGDSSALIAVPDTPQPILQSESSSIAPGAAAQSSSASSPAGTSDTTGQGQSKAQDPPGNPTTNSQAGNSQPQQTKRILGIIPNFRAVSADVKLPPETVKEKFLDATDDSFDYSSLFIPGMLAAYSMGTRAYPEFGVGAAGYARYFWHAAVDQTSENYMVEFIGPTLTREDGRYYTLGRGGFLKRTGYALSRAVITRTNAGNETFNVSEVVGAGASAGLSTLYYPSRERSLGNVGTEWGLDVGIDAASFMVKEFWPDINRRFFHMSN